MRIGELFAGYGGLGQGVQAVFGGEIAWFSEFDPAPSKILAHHFPGVPNHGDITLIDWSTVEPVDILTGGFPCQDVSIAGARAGLKEGTRSGLWSYFATAIDVLRPQLVVIENVRGLLSAKAGDHEEITDEWTEDEIDRIVNARGRILGNGAADRDMELRSPGVGESDWSNRPVLNAFGSVLGDLALLGYDAEWVGVRAADAGAPHGRYRVFILAHDTKGERRHDGHALDERPSGREVDLPQYSGHAARWASRASATAADSDDSGRSEHGGGHPSSSGTAFR